MAAIDYSYGLDGSRTLTTNAGGYGGGGMGGGGMQPNPRFFEDLIRRRMAQEDEQAQQGRMQFSAGMDQQRAALQQANNAAARQSMEWGQHQADQRSAREREANLRGMRAPMTYVGGPGIIGGMALDMRRIAEDPTARELFMPQGSGFQPTFTTPEQESMASRNINPAALREAQRAQWRQPNDVEQSSLSAMDRFNRQNPYLSGFLGNYGAPQQQGVSR